MIIIILSVVLLIVGIILTANGCCDWKEYLGLLLTVIPTVVLFFGMLIILFVQVNKEIDYQNKLYEREMLEYRIENADDSIVGNEMLYNDIVEFNNNLRSTKKWANNLWTNWFNNEDIATIDYIEIEKE